jgi:hypothetical protein
MVLLHQRAYVVGVYLQLTADGFDLACDIDDWLLWGLICISWGALLAPAAS